MNFDAAELNKIQILDVASRLGIEVKRNTALCFLHQERTPSLKFKISKNNWRCYGCGESGGVIDLVIKRLDFNFVDACKWLHASYFGFTHNPIIIQPKTKINKVKDSQRKFAPDPEVYTWLVINSQISQKAKEYLINVRKYPEKVIQEFKLRSFDSSKPFIDKCIKKWGIERLLKCGLIKAFKNHSSGEIFYGSIWWTETIIFPFFDKHEEIIYLQGRNINDSHLIKYINLEGVETNIFNLPILCTLQKNQLLVICEGVTDCITCNIMGKAAIGIIGAYGFKNQYLELLKDYRIIVIPDNDSAGHHFANSIKESFASIGKEIITIELEKKYKDISDLYIDKLTIP
jgi:DNA primase